MKLNCSHPKSIICRCNDFIWHPQNTAADNSNDPFYNHWNSRLIIMFFIISYKLSNIHSKQIGTNPSVSLNIVVPEPRAIASCGVKHLFLCANVLKFFYVSLGAISNQVEDQNYKPMESIMTMTDEIKALDGFLYIHFT